MKKRKISNRQQLLDQVDLLEERERFYRARIAADARSLLAILNDPGPYIRRTVKDMAADKTFRADLVSALINYLGNLATKKMQESDKLPGWLQSILNKFRGGNS